MALTIPTTGGAILCGSSTANPYARPIIRCHVISPLSSRRLLLHVASAKKMSGKNRKGGATTTTSPTPLDQERVDDRTAQIDDVDDGYVLPKLPGDEPDFWEGEKWDALGLFVEYMWAFGFIFALIACGVAVLTYNEGASDFKETPAYKESVQTQEFLNDDDTSSPDVFESNPTEVAPSLE